MSATILNEIILTVRRSRGARRAPVTVRVANADVRDRGFLAALARVAEVWFRAQAGGHR